MRGYRWALAVTCLAALGLAAPAGATFHGASGKIAFVHSAPGNPLQIYAMNPDGTDRTPLTSGPARNYSPDWSPDGSKIAFSSDRDDPNPGSCTSCNTEIYVMDANGGNVVRRTIDPAVPGGRFVIASDGSGGVHRSKCIAALRAHSVCDVSGGGLEQQSPRPQVNEVGAASWICVDVAQQLENRAARRRRNLPQSGSLQHHLELRAESAVFC